MKFKIGDTVLMRCKIGGPLLGNNVAVHFDGVRWPTVIFKEELEKAVPYPADIPLPNQEVWVRDEDNGEWMKGIYLYYNDKQDTNYPHVVWRDEGFTYEQKQVTTKNPHIKYRNAEIEKIEKRMREDADRLKELRGKDC